MRHIPNILSAFRLVLIPFFVWLMLNGHMLEGGLVLLVSGATDTLDGFLARRNGWISDLGKVLDPAADKLTQVAVYIVMVIVLRQYWVFFAIMMAKEVIMLCAGAYLMKKGVRLEGAHWFGKIATIVFYIVMVVVAIFPSLPSWLVITMLSVTTAVSVFAMLMYIPEMLRYLKNIKTIAAPAAEKPGKTAGVGGQDDPF